MFIVWLFYVTYYTRFTNIYTEHVYSVIQYFDNKFFISSTQFTSSKDQDNQKSLEDGEVYI